MRRLERILNSRGALLLLMVVTLVIRNLAVLVAAAAFVSLSLAFDTARWRRRRAARRAQRRFLDDCGSMRGRP